MPCGNFWQIFIISHGGLLVNPGEGKRCEFQCRISSQHSQKKDNPERWKNVVDLEKYGQPATEFLIQALADEDRWVRYLAANALADMGATNSVDSLISLLRDPEQDVRFAAAAALGKLGDPKAIKSLQEVLRKDNGYVKIAAEEAILMISPLNAGTPSI